VGCWAIEASPSRCEEEGINCEIAKNSGCVGLSVDNLLHLSRRCLASFKRRLSEEFEELPDVIGKTAFCCFE
jgi:hypothetical protein